MTEEQHFNVIFIGGGSGGYVGAIRAAQLGMQVAVIERDKIGGTCLHRGCVPSKCYLESAHVYTEFEHRETFGITAENIGYDSGTSVKSMLAGIDQAMMADIPHRVIQLHASFTDIGIGVVRSGAQIFITEDYGTAVRLNPLMKRLLKDSAISSGR